MIPTYQSACGKVKLWRVGFQKILIPQHAIVVTDPPYNIGKPKLIQKFKSKKTGTVQETVGNDFGEDFDEEAAFPHQWVPFMPDTVACFYGAKRMHKLIRAFQRNGYEIVQDFHWCKNNAPPPLRGVGFAWGTESGYVFRRKGTRHVVNRKAGYSPNFFVSSLCQGNERIGHSTQKPVNLMRWLVRFFSAPDSLIVDPFMGSGSVGVACAELGRNFWGMEQKEDYYNMAERRVKTAIQNRQDSLKMEY